MPERRITHLPDLLDAITAIDRQTLEYEHRKLNAIRDWALRQLDIDYDEGDRVVIIGDLAITPTRAWGWMPYREALARGATATVTGIDFNPHADHWTATIRLEREWSVSGHAASLRPLSRHWNGRADDTPAGYSPPSLWDLHNHPDGRRHAFAVPATALRAATDDDAGLTPPPMSKESADA